MESVLTSPTSIAHIVLVYALVISVGLALGRIKVFGVSLGVTFVLFVGLAAGHFGMAIEPHVLTDRKSTRLNSSHMSESRMPSSA